MATRITSAELRAQARAAKTRALGQASADRALAIASARKARAEAVLAADERYRVQRGAAQSLPAGAARNQAAAAAGRARSATKKAAGAVQAAAVKAAQSRYRLAVSQATAVFQNAMGVAKAAGSVEQKSNWNENRIKAQVLANATAARAIGVRTSVATVQVAKITARQLPEVQATSTGEAASTSLKAVIPLAALVIGGLALVMFIRRRKQ